MGNSDKVKEVEDLLRQESEQTLRQRALRYLQAKPHGIVPSTSFAPASAEVTLLFRDGHYYGCISLAQAVAEALVRFMCKRNSFRPGKSFELNIKKLFCREFITQDLRDLPLRIWEKRNDYHHLNGDIVKEREKLEALALEKARLLAKVEGKVFAFTVKQGKLVFQNPKYWDTNGPYATAYLKLVP